MLTYSTIFRCPIHNDIHTLITSCDEMRAGEGLESMDWIFKGDARYQNISIVQQHVNTGQ